MSNLRYICGAVALLIATLLNPSTAEAQYYKERGLVREGNSSFQKRNYRTSYNRYNEALEYDSLNYEALYNRANAHHHLRTSTPEDSTLLAETTYGYYEAIARDTLLSKGQRAEVLRNLGESLFSDQKYEAALNAFRESLLLNPDSKETKYNYVLTKRIVDQKRQQQQQNQDNQQNQDHQQKQNDQENQQNQDNQQNQNDQQQNQNDQQNQNEGDQPQEKPEEGNDEGQEQESPAEQQPRQLDSDKERMLNAIQAEEDKTQDKLKEERKGIVIPGKKNW